MLKKEGLALVGGLFFLAAFVAHAALTGTLLSPRQDNSLKADLSVVADVVVQKYADHKPLYRQQQAFARLNIPISRRFNSASSHHLQKSP